MSGSVDGVGQGLYQFLHKLSPSVASGSGAATQLGAAGSAGSSPSPAEAQGHHHHHHGGGQLFKAIADAVTTALQSAPSDGSSDSNLVIKDAIIKALQGGGTSATGGAPPAGTTPTPAGNDPDGDGDQDGAGSAGEAASGRGAFLQTLQKYGITPDQFRQDLIAALSQFQGSAGATSSAVANFPAGATVDTAS